MGHPSFQVVKAIFPSLFKNLNVGSLHCEVCELAKHKRVSFPISNKMSSFPFSLVHTDVWGFRLVFRGILSSPCSRDFFCFFMMNVIFCMRWCRFEGR